MLHGQTFKRHFENIGIDSVLRHDSLGTVPVYTSAQKTVLVKFGTTFYYYGAGFFGEVYHNLDSIFGTSTGDGWWGDGSDGSVTLTGNDSLSRDMFYDNLTIPAGDTLRPKGYRLFVRNVLTVNGLLRASGWNGGNGDTGGTFICGDSLSNHGGAAGGGGASEADAYLGQGGSAPHGGNGVGGGWGGGYTITCPTGVTFAGNLTCQQLSASTATSVDYAIGATGIAGGSSGLAGNTGNCGGPGRGDSCSGEPAGSFTAIASSGSNIYGVPHDLLTWALGRTFPRTSVSQTGTLINVTFYRYHGFNGGGSGGEGGGARTGGGAYARGGGGGGGGGAGGNGVPMLIVAKTITGTGAIRSNGGNGGNGGKAGNGFTSDGINGCGSGGAGAGGGAGGNAGVIAIIYRSISGITVTATGGFGGTGGAGGNAAGTGQNGTAGTSGQNGLSGSIYYYTL